MPNITNKEFVKMHGLGNDFIIFDQRQGGEYDFSPAELKLLADRHYGIGCDQLIILRRSAIADMQMLIFNADGSPAGACGNAARCVGLLSGMAEASIAIGERIIKTIRLANGHISVNMGQPSFAATTISVNIDEKREGIAVDMGNPHLVILLPCSPDGFAAKYGAQLEHHPYFPHGVNVNFAYVVDNANIILSVWERGAGETLACGSGACATYAAAHRLQLVAEVADIHLPGGILTLSSNTEGELLMNGAAKYVFKGVAFSS